ncbi:CYFIP-related Rac1 interactor A isoform X1 [Monodelphis domestica]|uniref:CYFIP-related Rac1 interactor A isoform X1 n=1 Tax=Monodelphis domestica TaxID=13616 RepID=UPI0024E199D2|nr:CYFIP-related Rac1 interactor A isoform X1 [Monodelphis domestica]
MQPQMGGRKVGAESGPSRGPPDQGSPSEMAPVRQRDGRASWLGEGHGNPRNRSQPSSEEIRRGATARSAGARSKCQRGPPSARVQMLMPAATGRVSSSPLAPALACRGFSSSGLHGREPGELGYPTCGLHGLGPGELGYPTSGLHGLGPGELGYPTSGLHGREPGELGYLTSGLHRLEPGRAGRAWLSHQRSTRARAGASRASLAIPPGRKNGDLWAPFLVLQRVQSLLPLRAGPTLGDAIRSPPPALLSKLTPPGSLHQSSEQCVRGPSKGRFTSAGGFQFINTLPKQGFSPLPDPGSQPPPPPPVTQLQTVRFFHCPVSPPSTEMPRNRVQKGGCLGDAPRLVVLKRLLYTTGELGPDSLACLDPPLVLPWADSSEERPSFSTLT